MDLLKDSLIPVSSALIVGSLTFSLFNLMNPINRIKIRTTKYFFVLLGVFFTCAAISSIVPYINGAPCWAFGYPVFWNALSVVFFIWFLVYSYRCILGKLRYKGKEEFFFNFLKDCLTKNISPSLFIDDVLLSFPDILDSAKKDQNVLDSSSKDWNRKLSWDIISLLSSAKMVNYMVEKDRFAVESIFNAYEKNKNENTNTHLINQLIDQLVSNPESFIRKQHPAEQKYEVNKLFSNDFVNKYMVVDFIKIERDNLDEKKLELFVEIYLRVLSKKYIFDYGFSFVLDYIISHEMIKKSTDRQYIEFEELFTETLNACSAHSWGPFDASYEESYFRRFDGFIESVTKKCGSDDCMLHLKLIKFWNVFKGAERTHFVSNFLSFLYNKLYRIGDMNVYLVRVFILMEGPSQGFSYYRNNILPHIQQAILRSTAEFQIIENNLPYGKTPGDVLKY